MFQLILKSIFYFKRQHLALFAGTLLSTAILTGAMITGDSVAYSLRRMVDLRLGKTEYTLETTDRFVSHELAEKLAAELKTNTAALIRNHGSAGNPALGKKVNKIEILGIDNNFNNLSGVNIPLLKADEAIISENLAEKLKLKTGDAIILRMEQMNIIPINAPFSPDNAASEPFRLKVVAVAGSDQLGRFSLQNNQVAPYNVFVSIDFLAQKPELKNLANLILIGQHENLDLEKVNRAFAHCWDIMDAGVEIVKLKDEETYALTSKRIFIESAIIDAAKNTGIKYQPILTYLVNEICFNEKCTPYSFVAASTPPLLSCNITANEIIINKWLADDLHAKTGDTLTLEYFATGPMRKIEVETGKFTVRKIIPLKNSPALRDMMPGFRGIVDAGDCSNWNTGVPIDLEKIRDKDEKYWDDYRGTPKAFISIEAGQKIWGNSYGKYTSLRFPANEIALPELKHKILSGITPPNLGLQFRPVRLQGLDAVMNAVDFGQLFLSLSFFVIAAGVLLTALLFSLHTASRTMEAGILAATGFSRRHIIRFRMLEALPVIVAGSVAGTFAGIFYNRTIMLGLNSVWQDVVQTTILWIHVEPSTLFIGAGSGIFVAFASIFVITQRKIKQPVKALITKFYAPQVKQSQSKYFFNTFLIIFATGSALALVSYSLSNNINENSGLFLTAGGLFLTGFLALIFRLLIFVELKLHTSPLSLFQLALKNTGRNKTRSLSTIALLALGVFTIIITGANQQTFYGTSNNRTSGTGGFLLWGESSLPIIYDLNTPEGKIKYGLDAEPFLDDVEFIQFHRLQGDDASCLNLNQVSRPQILGVDPRIFDRKGSFTFSNFLKQADDKHPWLLLNYKSDDNIIPAFADQTVITWGLMKKIGDTLTYLNETGKEIKLLLAGGLKNSVFQGNILIADSIFMANFPSADGSEVMLIDAPSENQHLVSEIIKNRLTDYGIELTPTNTRLATFNSVTNTYLSVFMILGGLGVLIGTIGLGIVLLRNILERKSELALLSAIGFSKNQILKLVFAESFVLLSAGIIAGILSASIGILPSILSTFFTINIPVIMLLVTLIFSSGIIWIYLPAKLSLKNTTTRDLQEE